MGCPLGPQGPSWDPLGLLRGDPASTMPPPKHADISLRSADLLFFSPFVARRTFSLKHLSRNIYKNKRIFTVFEIAISVSFSYFCNLWAPEGSSRPPLGESSGPFWAPLPPPGISERPPWSSWALPRVPFGLPLIDPRPKKTGLRQQRKTQFYSKNHTFGEAWF